jgi:hypothetical protein
MADVTPDLIFQVANGFMAAKHLFVANEIGLFEALADAPAPLDDVAQRTGIPRRTLRILADAMVALGFVERQGDLYRNSVVASTFLSGRTTADLRPALRYWNRLNYHRWTKLEEAVRTDQAVLGEFAFTAEEQPLYTEGVEAFNVGTARALAVTYDCSRHRRILDLGGGTGSFLTALLHQYSCLEATLYEPARCRRAGAPAARWEPSGGTPADRGGRLLHGPPPRGPRRDTPRQCLSQLLAGA